MSNTQATENTYIKTFTIYRVIALAVNRNIEEDDIFLNKEEAEAKYKEYSENLFNGDHCEDNAFKFLKIFETEVSVDLMELV